MTTIPADCIFMLVVGMLFSVSCFPQIERSGRLLGGKYFLAAIVFQTVFCMPVAIYCYVVFPDWCWMYWLDADRVPPLIVAAGFAFYYVACAAGFLAGVLLEKRRRGSGATGLGVSLLVMCVFFILTWKRLFAVVSIEDFRMGNVVYLHERTALFAAVAAGMALAIAALVVMLERFGRELDFRPSGEDAERFAGEERFVSIVRTGNDLREAIERSLSGWGGMAYIEKRLAEKGDVVLIKPGLAGGAKDVAGTQTSAEVIIAMADLVRSIRPLARIHVVESPSIVWRNLDLLLSGSVYERKFKDKGIEFLDLSRTPRTLFDFGGRMGKESVPSILLEKHVLIDMPVAKTHAFFRMSGALKNLFGLMPHAHKFIRYHTKGFVDAEGRIFLDIYRRFPPDLVVVDGTVSGEGLCPVAGRGRRTDFLITSNDALCADLVLSEIMGFKPAQIPYLRAASRMGCAPAYKTMNTADLGHDAFRLKKVRHRLLALVLNSFWIIKENIGAVLAKGH